MNVEAITSAAITALIFTVPDECPFTGSVGDINPTDLRRLRDECLKFITDNAELLTQADLTDEDVGINFVLTRNREGSGFWDRDLAILGVQLSTASQKFTSISLQKGSDGQWYIY